MSKEPDGRYGEADDAVDALEDAVQAQEKRRKYWSWCFWAGVGMAPLAALLLILGQGVAPLRAAAVLAVLAVVLIGLSVTFRDDPSAVRDELTDELRHELEQVRTDLATLRRGVELTVHRELDRVRGELEAARTVLHTEATRLPEYDGGQYEYAEVNYEPTSGGAGRVYQGGRAEEYAGRDGAGDFYEAPPARRYADYGGPRDDRDRGTTYGRTYGRGQTDYDIEYTGAEYDTGDYFPDVQTVEPIREEYAPARSANAASETRLLPPGGGESRPNATVYGARRPEAALEQTQWDTPAVVPDDAPYPPSVPKKATAAAAFAGSTGYESVRRAANPPMVAGLSNYDQGDVVTAFVTKDVELSTGDHAAREHAVPIYDGDAFGMAASQAAAQQAERISHAAVYGSPRSREGSDPYSGLSEDSWGWRPGELSASFDQRSTSWSNPISASPYGTAGSGGAHAAEASFGVDAVSAEAGRGGGRHSAPSSDSDASWYR